MAARYPQTYAAPTLPSPDPYRPSHAGSPSFSPSSYAAPAAGAGGGPFGAAAASSSPLYAAPAAGGGAYGTARPASSPLYAAPGAGAAGGTYGGGPAPAPSPSNSFAEQYRASLGLGGGGAAAAAAQPPAPARSLSHSYGTDGELGVSIAGGARGGAEAIMSHAVGVHSAASQQIDESEPFIASIISLIDRGELCDVVFVVGRERARLHGVRAVLATRSAVFKEMLLTRDSSLKREVVMGDYGHKSAPVNPAAFRKMLEFSMSGRTRLESSTALEVMQLAFHFQLSGLKALCGGFVAEHLIAVESAAMLLQSAVTLEEPGLAQACIRFIEGQTAAVIRTEGFLSPNLSVEVLVLLLQSDVLNCDELQLYESVKIWGSNLLTQNPHLTLREIVQRPLQHLRLSAIPTRQLNTGVRDDGLAPTDAILDALAFQADHSAVDGSRRSFKARAHAETRQSDTFANGSRAPHYGQLMAQQQQQQQLQPQYDAASTYALGNPGTQFA